MASLPEFPFAYSDNYESDARAALTAWRALCLSAANEIETARAAYQTLAARLDTLAGGGGMASLFDDSTPELGGDLDGLWRTIHNVGLRNVSEVCVDHGVTDADDDDAVAASQRPLAAGNLTLTGSPVVTNTPRLITVTVAGNESGVAVTLYYRDENGTSQTAVANLPSVAGNDEFGTGIWATEISQISVNGACAGNISFGFGDSRITFDYSAGSIQAIQFGGDAEIHFTGWPSSGAGAMTLVLSDCARHLVTLPQPVPIVTNASVSSIATDQSFNSTSLFGTGNLLRGDTVLFSGFAEETLNNTFPVAADATASKILVMRALLPEVAGANVSVYRKTLLTDGADPVLGERTVMTIWTVDGGRNLRVGMGELR